MPGQKIFISEAYAEKGSTTPPPETENIDIFHD